MLSRNQQGQTIRVFTYNTGAMRKHGGDARQPQDATLAALDELAHRRVAPASAAGYVVRRRTA